MYTVSHASTTLHRYATSEEGKEGWMQTLRHVIAVADARAEWMQKMGVEVQDTCRHIHICILYSHLCICQPM